MSRLSSEKNMLDLSLLITCVSHSSYHQSGITRKEIKRHRRTAATRRIVQLPVWYKSLGSYSTDHSHSKQTARKAFYGQSSTLFYLAINPPSDTKPPSDSSPESSESKPRGPKIQFMRLSSPCSQLACNACTAFHTSDWPCPALMEVMVVGEDAEIVLLGDDDSSGVWRDEVES